jgi:hypothetical protein
MKVNSWGGRSLISRGQQMPLGTQQKKQPACSWPEPLALRLVPRNPSGAPGARFLAWAGSGLLGGTRGRSSGEVGREACRGSVRESTLSLPVRAAAPPLPVTGILQWQWAFSDGTSEGTCSRVQWRQRTQLLARVAYYTTQKSQKLAYVAL